MKKQTYKKMFNVALTTTLAAGAVVAVAPQAEAAISFTDVKESNVHYADIMNLAERGIIRGYGDGTFRPGISITRGHAAHIIAEIIDLDTTNVTNPKFTDITTKHANYGAIAALAKAGIIHGFEDGSYRPNDKLTRGQMAKIIAKAFNLNPSSDQLPFKDVERSIYKDHIIALFENNVTKGMTAAFFGEKSFVTRGQLSSFVVRAEKAVEPTPTPVIPKEDKDKFESNLVKNLNELTVPGVVEVKAEGTTVNITASENITKTQLAGLSKGVIDKFKGLGTTALLSSVTINNTPYSSAQQLDNKEGIALSFAGAMELKDAELLAVAGLTDSQSLWDALGKSSYSAPITLDYKDGTKTIVTINLNEKAK